MTSPRAGVVLRSLRRTLLSTALVAALGLAGFVLSASGRARAAATSGVVAHLRHRGRPGRGQRSRLGRAFFVVVTARADERRLFGAGLGRPRGAPPAREGAGSARRVDADRRAQLGNRLHRHRRPSDSRQLPPLRLVPECARPADGPAASTRGSSGTSRTIRTTGRPPTRSRTHNCIKAAYPAIKAADPSSVVLLGADRADRARR